MTGLDVILIGRLARMLARDLVPAAPKGITSYFVVVEFSAT
jgi:hypothetical protein